MLTLTDWRATLARSARAQFHGLFACMANEGGRWHLYRFDTAQGTTVALLREGAKGSEAGRVLVPNVQGCDVDTLVIRLHGALQC